MKGQVTTVCLSGSPDLVHESREVILNETPLALVSVMRRVMCECVHADGSLAVCDGGR